jgi:di/tricarboxylate transporter
MIPELGWDAWATVGIIILMLVALLKDIARPDMILLGCLGLLLLLGILPPEDAFAGLSNKAVLAVGALFVVAAGVQNTGALQFTDRLLFPRSKNLPVATARLMLTTASMSAFLNNTPIVAMLIPRVRAWCEKTGVPASKLMIPLSFGAIVGGMTTLIGTSTNLLVAGLMEASGYGSLGLFDLAWVGVPAALGAILYFTLIGHHLLPDRSKEGTDLADGLREYIFEVRVAPSSPLVGLSVEQADLRALEDAYLVHLRRGEEIIPSSPEAVLHAGDVLTFVGSPSILDRLLERPGLERVQQSMEASGHTTLPLYEAVVSPSSNLVGKSLREVRFREHYQGVVLGIHRREATIEGSLSRVPIKAGDLLLVEARNGFDKRWNQIHDEFYLVAPRRPERVKPQVGKAPLALAILAGVILFAAFGVADIVTTAFIGALAMIVTGCLRGRDARRAVDIPVLIVIAAALGLGRAIESTGLAATGAHLVTEQASIFGAVGVVAAVYVATNLLTELITNNAAAALMVGVGLAASQELGVPPEAFAVAVAIAASASFLTPIGYQTNLMVLAAGGYRFSDFTKTGLPVNLVVGVIAVAMIWLIWL